MANEIEVTIVGNVTADPELRYTASGHPVCNFTVAQTPRNFDKGTQEWSDGEAMFFRCAVWREPAENVADTLSKGMRVIVKGRMVVRSYQTKRGETRQSFDVTADEVGPSLRFARAQVAKYGGGVPSAAPGSVATAQAVLGGGHADAWQESTPPF